MTEAGGRGAEELESYDPVGLDGADMAAIMRELSSLGGAFDTDSEAAPVTTSRPVPTQPDPKAAKKRKGLFGR
jgi:hypothetical protein